MPIALKLAAPLGLALLLALPAHAQEPAESLVEAAAKEKERRKAPAKAKPYTESDLAKARRPGDDVATPEPAASPSPRPGAKREKTDEELRAEKKDGYQKRIAAEVATSEVVRKAMSEAQLELNDMTTLTQFGTRKEALQKILDDGAAELKRIDATIAAIEEEARREGMQVSRP